MKVKCPKCGTEREFPDVEDCCVDEWKCLKCDTVFKQKVAEK